MGIGASVSFNQTGTNVLVVTTPVNLPVLIEDTRAYCRINTGSDDYLLQMLILSASDEIEEYLSRKLITQTIEVIYSRGVSEIYLPYADVQSVSNVYIGDGDGSYTETTDFYVEGNKLYIQESIIYSLKVKYIAGYGDTTNDIPVAIKRAIYKNVLDAYDNREGKAIGETVGNLTNWKTDIKQFIYYEGI